MRVKAQTSTNHEADLATHNLKPAQKFERHIYEFTIAVPYCTLFPAQDFMICSKAHAEKSVHASAQTRARLSWYSIPFIVIMVCNYAMVQRHPILLVATLNWPPAIRDASFRRAYKFHGIRIEREQIVTPRVVNDVPVKDDRARWTLTFRFDLAWMDRFIEDSGTEVDGPILIHDCWLSSKFQRRPGAGPI